MRIGLNLLFMTPRIVGGTDSYAVSLINALAKIDAENQYFIFTNRETSGGNFQTGDNFTFVPCPIKSSNWVSRSLWEQLVLPSQARGYQLDLMHSLGSISPLLLSLRTIVTIPDLIYRAVPLSFPRISRAVQNFFVENSARRVTKIITFSEFIREEVIQRLGIPAEKVLAIPLAPQERETGQQISWDELILKHRINRPFVIVMSGKLLHKNIPRLVEAFLRANHQLGHAFQLIVGGHLPDHGESARLIKKVADESSDIRVTGYISDDELSELLAHATAYALPSLYEGFGLPALQAMAAGVPLISSDRAALPEVSGDAALYFDPMDVDGMAASLIKILSDSELRSRLIANGTENLKRFSWETTARQTLAVYQSLE